MSNNLEKNVKKNMFQAVKFTLIVIIGLLAAIFLVVAFVPEAYLGACMSILVFGFAVVLISYAVKKSRQNKKLYDNIENAYAEGAVTEEAYKEMSTTKAKYQKIAMVCVVIVVLIRIIIFLTK